MNLNAGGRSEGNIFNGNLIKIIAALQLAADT